MWFYQILDILFFIFHSAIVFFNVFGWIHKSTRKYHLIVLGITLFSWCILGIWYGFGYCVCTDWQFQIREKMGIYDESYHYIHFLILVVTGVDTDIDLVSDLTYLVFGSAIFMTLVVNLKPYFSSLTKFRAKKIKDRGSLS